MNFSPLTNNDQIKAISVMSNTQLRLADRHLSDKRMPYYYAVCNAALKSIEIDEAIKESKLQHERKMAVARASFELTD